MKSHGFGLPEAETLPLLFRGVNSGTKYTESVAFVYFQI